MILREQFHIITHYSLDAKMLILVSSIFTEDIGSLDWKLLVVGVGYTVLDGSVI